MGTYIHSTIVVTGSDVDQISRAHSFAESLGLFVSGVTIGRNNYSTFYVPPTGGAAEHPAAENNRLALDALADYLAGRVGLDWISVDFGREHGPAALVGDCASAASRAAARWTRPRR